jgi:addiction module RelE/StbE family toxin
MRIRWTPPAAADLQNISDYLQDHHPQYRQPTMRRLYERLRALKDAPFLGRPGRIEGTRELLFSPLPYIAVYRVHEQSIEIWRIHHTAQDRS